MIIKHKFRNVIFLHSSVFVRKARSAGLLPSRARRAGAAESRDAEHLSLVIAPPNPDLPRCLLRAQWLRTHPAQLAPESYFRLRPAVVCNHACAQRPRVLVSAVPIEEGASEKTAAYKGTPGGWLRNER